jgi:hypothetical protein
MKAIPRWSIAAALALLALLGIMLSQPGREWTPTTFGTIPPAYGALFELMVELKLPVARSLVRPERLTPGGTVWWIDASSLCQAAAATPSVGSLQPVGWPAADWVRAGGTAVVLLSPGGSCEAIAGILLPNRSSPKLSDTPIADATKRQPGFGDATYVPQILVGRSIPAARTLEAREPFRTFTGAGDWEIAAQLDGSPFILERPLGDGRLVVAADATFLSNALLDRADNGPCSVDLVRTYGVPRFDEWEHGLRADESAASYLATSPAGFVFFGLAACGLLFLWRGHILPPRSVVSGAAAAPVLEAFVSSVAALYARSRDHSRILGAYRELTLARLRRHFGLPPNTSPAMLLERLRARRTLPAAQVAALSDALVSTDEASLRRAARALDNLLWEAMQ